MPPVVIAAPASIGALAPMRPISCPTIPETTTIVPASGRKATPDRSAL